jgi:glycosyltransferase involved in cell wall biosynthesis
MSGRPLVSVLMPVRNGLPWLPSALDSLLHQTLRDIEVIVLEDGSTDATPATLAAYRDPRVRVIPTGGVGIAAALNEGLAAARGIYVARQDADDESRPQRLARQAACLDARRDIDVVATVADYMDVDGRPLDNEWVRTIRRQQDVALEPDAIAALMPLTCCVTHGSIMARPDVLRQAGGYRAAFIPADDYELWLRLLPEHRFAKLPEPLYRYRVHASQLGSQLRTVQTTNAIRAKLDHVRRRFPMLPAQPGLAVEGTDRGDAFYREVAPGAGFTGVDVGDAWDVLAVTDLARVDDVARRLQLQHLPGLEQVGNFFVRAGLRTMRRTA